MNNNELERLHQQRCITSEPQQEMDTCPCCEGSGEVRIEVDKFDPFSWHGHYMVTQTVECDHCQGYGEIAIAIDEDDDQEAAA